MFRVNSRHQNDVNFTSQVTILHKSTSTLLNKDIIVKFGEKTEETSNQQVIKQQ